MPASSSSSWGSLPEDILEHVFDHLEARDVGRLARVSRGVAAQVDNIAWPNLVRRYAMHHITLSPPASTWSAPTLARLNLRAASGLANQRFLARQIGRTWERTCMPIMHLCASGERLLVGAGRDVLVHDLVPLAHGSEQGGRGGRTVGRITSCASTRGANAWDDLTGLVGLPDGQVVLSTLGGVIRRARLPSNKEDATAGWGQGQGSAYRLAPLEVTAHYAPPTLSSPAVTGGTSSAAATPTTNAIETLSASGKCFLAAARDGSVALYDASAPWIEPQRMRIDARPWSSLLALEGGAGGIAAIGSSGVHPLQVFDVSTTGIKGQAIATLNGPTTRSAVYAMAQPPSDMAMPYAHRPGTLLLSAWYDGVARLHDLRAGGASVMSMSDPWSDSSLYSCGFVGAGWVVAGGARHGLVHFWDPRMTGLGGRVGGRTSGWSAFAPGRPESPVYELRSEGSRVWGVTSESAFVMAFDTVGEEGAAGAQGWDVVPPRLRVPSGEGASGQHRKTPVARVVWSRKDWSTGYRHEDRSVRLFDSLGAGK